MELAKAKHAVRVDNDGIITHVIPEWANDTHILPYGNSALDSALPELRRIAGIYHYTNDPYYRQMYIDLHNKTMESLAGEGLSIYTPNKDRLVEALNLYLNTKPVNPELQTWDPIENKLSTISGRWNNARYFGKGYDRHETLVPSLKGAFLENTSLSRPFGGVLSAVSNTPANMTQSNALMFQIEKYITQLKLSRSPQAYVKLRNLLWGFGIDFKNNTATLRNDFENDDTARRIALAVQERINTPPDEVSYAGQPEPFTGPHTQEIFNSNRNTVRQAPYNEYETPYFDYRQTWRRQ
ncbi:MAG: hypothetical protein LBQ12_14250 [Deltaproteobacteria bacterium]|jgi:hypothetical protein|nr:hypothetical protein [Deltaproteobacteria bacterium]